MPLLPLIVSHNAEKLSRGGGLLMRAGAALWLHGQEGGRRCVEERRDAGAEPELEQRWAAQLAEALGCALRGRRARVATPLKKSLLSLPLIYGKSDSTETLVSSHQYDSPSFSVSLAVSRDRESLGGAVTTRRGRRGRWSCCRPAQPTPRCSCARLRGSTARSTTGAKTTPPSSSW